MVVPVIPFVLVALLSYVAIRMFTEYFISSAGCQFDAYRTFFVLLLLPGTVLLGVAFRLGWVSIPGPESAWTVPLSMLASGVVFGVASVKAAAFSDMGQTWGLDDSFSTLVNNLLLRRYTQPNFGDGARIAGTYFLLSVASLLAVFVFRWRMFVLVTLSSLAGLTLLFTLLHFFYWSKFGEWKENHTHFMLLSIAIAAGAYLGYAA